MKFHFGCIRHGPIYGKVEVGTPTPTEDPLYPGGINFGDGYSSEVLHAGGNESNAILVSYKSLLLSAIGVIGLIVLAYGILQWGSSFSSHDPSARNQGILCVFAGLLLCCLPAIMGVIL